ncbi:kinase-like domain-containing protein [Mycena olivaceomarginata]|nr:kinase-like domain-containing protein [Mycena olivaceomarginata]
MNPPIPQPRGLDPRFPYEWEVPPPSYETATSISTVANPSRRVSYTSSFDKIVSDISARHAQDLHSHFEGDNTSLAVDGWSTTQPPVSRDIPYDASTPRLRITPPQGSSPQSTIPRWDSPFSTNEATVSTVRPTAIHRRPLAQAQSRSNLAPPIASSSAQRLAPTPTVHKPAHRSTKPVYGCTLGYLKGVASEHDSGPFRSLDCFGREMAKLGTVDCLVYALQYKEALVKASTDLGVADHPKFTAALEKDQTALGDRILEVLYSPADERAILALEDNAAQSLLDIIQHTLDNALLPTRDATSKARRLIGKLAKAADKLPSSLIISGVTQRDEHASFCGGFGDVFRAMYQGKPVALKHMRMFQSTDQRDIRRKFCREALVWQRLRHPYIVPLIGIDTESFPSSLSMVSPWMKHGTIIKYLSGIPDSARQFTVNRLIREIAQGLAFLHDQRVVHGDLRGSNILVDDTGSACLTDFGLTVLSDVTATQTNHGAGSVRWMAPETLDPSACGLTEYARTPASDIYAFACVCLELYTGYPPFHDAILFDAPVMLQVVAGARPSRPAGNCIPDHIWNIMQQCWAQDFAERPSILGIVLELAMHERMSGMISSFPSSVTNHFIWCIV